MVDMINASITPKAAVRLLISNELDIRGYWETEQAERLLDELYDTRVDELLRVIDCMEPLMQVDSITLPQFGSIDTLIRVPEVLASTGIDGLSYGQLGFYLKNDSGDTYTTIYKFGENHGKGASLLGVTVCENHKIYFGALTNTFYGIGDKAKQYALMQKLFFRIPLIQTLLHQAKDGRVNGYAPMRVESQKTKKRRGSCARTILKELHTLGNETLDQRINNIYWDLDEENM